MYNEEKELISLTYPCDDIQTINIVCKNYKVHITESAGEEITIRYFNNRFRKMEIRKGSNGIYLEENMKITIYGILRTMELMDSNELIIEIPACCRELNFMVETGVTGISIEEITVQSIHAASASGQILIRNVYIGKNLYAQSTSEKVSCFLPGTVNDYDIDCRAERMDVRQPYYPTNHAAEKKITLRSNMYVPDLIFTSEKK